MELVNRRVDPFVRIREAPFELDGLDLEGSVTVGELLVLHENDARVDADEDDEHSRDRRPQDLDAGVAVDRLAVLVVVGSRPELQDRIDRDRGDEREDDQADDRHRDVDVVDAPTLLRRERRQPVDPEPECEGDGADDDGDREQLDDQALAHVTTGRPDGQGLAYSGAYSGARPNDTANRAGLRGRQNAAPPRSRVVVSARP